MGFPMGAEKLVVVVREAQNLKDTGAAGHLPQIARLAQCATYGGFDLLSHERHARPPKTDRKVGGKGGRALREC